MAVQSVRLRSWAISLPGWSRGVLLYGICFTVLSVVMFATPGFLSNDDYYHARLSAQILEQGRLAVNFPWLPKTILSPTQFVDHHLLFHMYVAPWMALGGMNGAKLATVSIAAGVFVVSWLLLRQIGVSNAALWTLGLFGLSTPFIYRMLMVRTQGAALLLLLLALSIVFSRRYWLLLPLAFAYAWLYNGFVLILGVIAMYTAAVWIAERRFEWKPLAWCAIGLVAGLVINPYFPANVLFAADHLGAKVDLGDSVRVGNEWYPYTTGVLLNNSTGALLVLLLAAFRPSLGEHKRDTIETTLFLVAVMTLFMVFRSRRFIEYYPAFGLLWCAAAWGRQPISLRALLPRWIVPRLATVILTLAVIVPAATLCIMTVNNAFNDARDATDVQYMAGASEWLRNNTPQSAMVFQTDWDDFPYLFYHNTHNVYLVGLDPTYLEIADKALWDEWVDITQGRVETPSSVIRSRFNASYIVSDTNHENFNEMAYADPGLELVYSDEFSFVWQVKQ